MASTEKSFIEKNIAPVFHWIFVLIGASVLSYSVVNLPFDHFGLDFILISGLMLALGSKVAIDFRAFKSNLSVADVFTYIILILYGVQAATIIAAMEAYITSSKFTKKIEYRLFNSGIIGISMYVSYLISYAFFGPFEQLAKNGFTLTLFGAMCVLTISHYFINTFIVAISSGLRTKKSVFRTWTKYYVWMFIPFFASGSVALFAANAIQTSGLYAFLIILPIIGIIYFSYHTQQGKLQAVTDQAEQAEKHLNEMKQSEERFRSAFSNAPIGIGIISKENKWLQANDSLCGIFGFTEEELLTKFLHEIVHPEDISHFFNNISLVLNEEEKSFQAELRYFNKNGKEIWTQTSISNLKDAEDSKLICQIQDITARHKAEEKLRYDASFDSLTDLYNRNVFLEKLTKAVKRGQREKDFDFAVIFVDLDKFKLVNDTIGHTIGDKLLVAVAKRLKKCMPEEQTLARFGSDEFLILIDKDTEKEKLNFLVEEIQRQIGLVYGIDGQGINITASLGVVYFDETHKVAEDILRDADTALYLAKQKGRSRYVFFDEQMRKKATNLMKLEKDLQRAVERKELYLTYQPIISLDDEKLAGFEALIRWNHPEMGLVSPAEFISIAEENGQIIKIGHFVLDEACRQMRLWQNEFSDDLPITMSVNVSTKQLLRKQLLTEVLEIFEKYKISPAQIKLEITESLVVENSDSVMLILKQFRAMGLKISMDDFGTGYSSLSYLHKLPINTLKIDRSFVNQMLEETEGAEIVKTIVLLTKALNLDVVAEGIETKEQQFALRKLGCEFGQGYYFSKPLNVDDATNFIKDSYVTPKIPAEDNIPEGFLI